MHHEVLGLLEAEQEHEELYAKEDRTPPPHPSPTLPISDETRRHNGQVRSDLKQGQLEL